MIVGIDPGKLGAIAALWDDGEGHSVTDMPESALGIVRRLSELATAAQSRHETIECCTERLHAMPSFGRQSDSPDETGLNPKGAVANFKQGYTYGQLVGIFAALDIPYVETMPAVWKRFFELPLGRDKAASLEKARSLFPRASLARMKDDGRAEALLIAEFHRRKTHPAPEDLLGRRQPVRAKR